MAFSLYDATVANYLQTLGAVGGFLERGLKHLQDNNIDPNEVVDVRLFPDMLPFWFQISSVAHHSADAIAACKQGVFSPGGAQPPLSYADLQKLIADARAALQAVTPEEINALEGRDMFFQFGERKMPFTVEGFLMSFSMPNLHFHATTGYDILRTKGVPLGKRDYMGPLRLKV